jgi:Mg/Co/Ni transporter MgtE
MRAAARTTVARLIRAGAFASLRDWLRRADRAELARLWPRLAPLHKLAAFKLMDAVSALAFYRGLPYRERYFLFCGFPLQSIAPLIADAPASARRLFVQLPAKSQGAMLADLGQETAKALR